MFKLKNRKSALKRYKKSGNSNVLRRHAYKGHLLRKKSNVQKRRLSQPISISINDKNVVKLMLPYLN